MMRVAIRTMKGDLSVECAETGTVADLKVNIERLNATEHPRERQRLIYKGRVLVDDMLIKDAGIEGNVVHLVNRPLDAAGTTSSPPPPAAAPSPTVEAMYQNMLTLRTLLSTTSTAAATVAAAADAEEEEDGHEEEEKEGEEGRGGGLGGLAEHIVYYVGQWVDCLDTVQEWLEATILRIEGGLVFVHFNGWPARWDEWIDCRSARLAPFRSHTQHQPSLVASPMISTPLLDAPSVLPRAVAADPRRMLPDLGRVLAAIQPMVAEAASLVESAPPHSTVPSSFSSSHAEAEDEAVRLARLTQELCPLLDRLGRMLTDMSPLLSPPTPAAYQPPSPPRATAAQAQAASYFRQPINAPAATAQPHGLDIHIAILAPPQRRSAGDSLLSQMLMQSLLSQATNGALSELGELRGASFSDPPTPTTTAAAAARVRRALARDREAGRELDGLLAQYEGVEGEEGLAAASASATAATRQAGGGTSAEGVWGPRRRAPLAAQAAEAATEAEAEGEGQGESESEGEGEGEDDAEDEIDPLPDLRLDAPPAAPAAAPPRPRIPAVAPRASLFSRFRSSLGLGTQSPPLERGGI